MSDSGGQIRPGVSESDYQYSSRLPSCVSRCSTLSLCAAAWGQIIGATSHYVTGTLDAGPIIEQDIMRVTHRHSVQDLIRFGRDLEKIVLSRAIRAHLHRKIIVHE